jgi:hypothetical protein
MSLQYLRKVQLLLGTATGNALDFSDFQFKFMVRRGDIQTPNNVLIRIYNVAEATASKIQKEFTQLILSAGYEGNFGIIFKGTIKYVYKGHESNVDSYVDVVAADGDSAYNFAVVNTSLAAGSVPTDHYGVILNAMQVYGISAATTNQLEDNAGLPRGKVFYGMARDKARILANSTGTSWSIQDSKLQFILQTSYLPGDPVKLTSATGLVGFPEQTQNGIRIRTLLNPSIKIGTRVQIDNASVQQFHFDIGLSGALQQGVNGQSPLVPSLAADGMYKTLIAEHTGDTRGNEYYSELTCIGVNASIPLSLVEKAGVQPYVGP